MAGLSRTIINPQPLLIKIRRIRRLSEIEQAVRFSVRKFQLHRAAEFHRLGQNSPDGPPQFFGLRQGQFAGRKLGRNFCAKECFAGIDVSDAGHNILVQQFYFDGLA